jgi:hypothetical protein
MVKAFNEFSEQEEWQKIERAISSGRDTALRYAQTMSTLFLRGKEKGDLLWAEKEMQEQLLRPLGISKQN